MYIRKTIERLYTVQKEPVQYRTGTCPIKDRHMSNKGQVAFLGIGSIGSGVVVIVVGGGHSGGWLGGHSGGWVWYGVGRVDSGVVR